MTKEEKIKEANLKYKEGSLGLLYALKDIENNNGWVKIKSEEDLPKEEGYYHIIDLNRTEMQLVKFDVHHNVIVDYWIKNITHYQQIDKPKPPIY